MKPRKKLFISCFILLNFLSMVRIHMPLANEHFKALYRPVDNYLNFFSLFQSWKMFAPNPSKLNSYLTAEVIFSDGTTDTYFFPRSSQMNLQDKYINGERYRVITELIRRDENSFLWKDTAKFALRKLKEKNFHKIPMKVHLIRHWNEIPPIEKVFRRRLAEIEEYDQYRFYTYEVF